MKLCRRKLWPLTMKTSLPSCCFYFGLPVLFICWLRARSLGVLVGFFDLESTLLDQIFLHCISLHFWTLRLSFSHYLELKSLKIFSRFVAWAWRNRNPTSSPGPSLRSKWRLEKLLEHSRIVEFCHVTHDEMAFSEVVSSVWWACLFSAIWNRCSNETRTFRRIYVTKF